MLHLNCDFVKNFNLTWFKFKKNMFLSIQQEVITVQWQYVKLDSTCLILNSHCQYDIFWVNNTWQDWGLFVYAPISMSKTGSQILSVTNLAILIFNCCCQATEAHFDLDQGGIYKRPYDVSQPRFALVRFAIFNTCITQIVPDWDDWNGKNYKSWQKLFWYLYIHVFFFHSQ